MISIPEAFERYRGLRPWLPEARQRADLMIFTLQTEMLAHPETPFGAMARHGILLHEETEAFLYGDWGKSVPDYRPGSRPLLERYIAQVTDDRMSPADKVVALCLSMRSIPDRFGTVPAFLYGESDEEVLLKGGGHCSCRSRLLCALAQILGLPARPVLIWTWRHPDDPETMRGGHTVAEVLIDGQWGFFDPNGHHYCRTHDGSFPSVRMIRRQPELFTRMPERYLAGMRPITYRYCADEGRQFDHYWHRYLHPRAPISISCHDVTADYRILWNWATDDFNRRRRHDSQVLTEAVEQLVADDALTEDVYRLDLKAFRQHLGITACQVPAWNE